MTKVYVNKNETYWSVNIKKAILSVLSKNNTVIRQEQQEQQQQQQQYTSPTPLLNRQRYSQAKNVMEVCSS